MTPEEIMGVAPEQRAPSQKRDAGSQSDDNNLSPMDRYLERQYPSETMRNNLSGDSSRSQNFFGSDNDQTNGGGSAFSDVVNNGLDDQRSVTTLSPSANNAPDHNAAEGPNTESVWSKLLGTPALQPNPNDAQQPVGVDQFQQLLNPSPATPMVSTPLPNPATSFNAQNNLSDSDSTQPLANPVGASFAPLSSGIGRPMGLATLPGITGQAGVPAATPPAWAPQPAPWTSTAPQPFAVPQRKF